MLRSFVALSYLAGSPNPQVQKAIREVGLVGRFVGFLKSQKPMLFMEGAKAMVKFSEHQSLREEVARMGGIPALVVATTKDDTEACLNALIALKNMASEGSF